MRLHPLDLGELGLVQFVINEAVAEGIIDVRLIQAKLDDHIRERHIAYRNDDERKRLRREEPSVAKNNTKMRKEMASNWQTAPNCPECGSKMIIEGKVVNNKPEFILHCKHDGRVYFGCTYSEYLGNETELKKRMGIK